MAYNRPSGKSLFGPTWSGITPGATSNCRRKVAARTVQNSASKKSFGGAGGGGQQQKRSLDGGRPSTLNLRPPQSSGRSSSFYAGRMVVKDTRNLTDKATQHQMKMRLIKALTELEFPQLSEKMLKQPTKVEFIRIFEHIFKTVGGHEYKCSIKIEEEIPRLFRDMGYPFPLKASTMMTISATHSWPHVLGALVWLVDLIKFGEDIDLVQMLYGSQDDFSDKAVCHKQILYGYYKTCFNLKLSSDDDEFQLDYKGLDTFLENQLMDGEGEEGEASMEELHKKSASLQEEREHLKAAPHEDVVLEDEIRRVNVDMAKMTDYLKKMRNYQGELHEQIETPAQRRQAMEKEREDVNVRISQKEEMVANQKLSVNQVRQMRFKKDEAERRLKILTEEMKEKNQVMWSLETLLSRQKEEIEQKYRNFSQGFRLLVSKLQPAGEEWGKVVDFTVVSPFNPGFAALCNDVLKKYGKQLLTFCKQRLRNTKNDILELNKALDQYNESVMNAREEAEDLASKAELMEREMEEYKSMRVKENQKVKQELGRKRDRLAGENHVRNMSFQEKEKESHRLDRELKLQKKKLDADLSKQIKEVVDSAQFAADHKTNISKMQDEAAAQIEKMYWVMKNKQ